MKTESIPSDLADAWSSNVLKRRKLAELIRDACVNVGFFYGALYRVRWSFVELTYSRGRVVANHGISQATIDAAIEGGKTFFELPEDAKMSVSLHSH